MTSSRGSISCVIDTDICIDYLRGHEYTRPLMANWIDRGLLAISVVTHLEIFQGMRPNEEALTITFLDSLVAIDVNIILARRAGRLMGEFRRQGVTLSIGDTIIGATALEYGVPLITNNIRHYPFQGLTLFQGLVSS